MQVPTINVERRSAAGTNHVRRLRDSGKIPLVLYGGGKDPLSLQADYVEMKRHLEHHVRVYKLRMESVEQPGYMHDVQWDCLTDEPLHVDFQRIEMDRPLKMDVELAILGHPKGESAGGRLIRDVQYLHLACLPAHVPEQVELRVGEMDCGDKVFAREIELPEGCSLDMPEDQLIVHVTEEASSPPPVADETAAGAEAPADGSDPAPDADT